MGGLSGMKVGEKEHAYHASGYVCLVGKARLNMSTPTGTLYEERSVQRYGVKLQLHNT